MKIKFSAIIGENSAIKAVERNGDALQYVKDQSEAVCLKAVERNGYALRYVKDQSEAVCLKAVESNFSRRSHCVFRSKSRSRTATPQTVV